MCFCGSNSKDADQPSVEFNCAECDVGFNTRFALKQHIKRHHIGEQISLSPKSFYAKLPFSKQYKCPFCSFSTLKRGFLDTHMEEHVTRDLIHPCGEKIRSIEVPYRLKYFPEEYMCPYCSYSCTVYKALRKHVKNHLSGAEEAILKFSCKICGKDFETKVEMTEHMEEHTSDDRFVCDLCGFSSRTLNKTVQHRRVHNGEKPHFCPYCIFRSARRDNLICHVRRKHHRKNLYIDTFNMNEGNPLSVTHYCRRNVRK